MPRLTLKLSGAGRLLVAHRDVEGPVSQADLDALADEAARKHGGKRTATRLGADRRGDATRGTPGRTASLAELAAGPHPSTSILAASDPAPDET